MIKICQFLEFSQINFYIDTFFIPNSTRFSS